MSRSVHKFIAVLLAIWLPIFSGSALAASVSMQISSGQLQQFYTASDDMAMPDHGDSCEQHSASDGAPNHAPDHHGCSACGVCHLACSGYLAVSAVSLLTISQPDVSLGDYVVSFNSTTSIPLLPPPLARA